MCPYRAVRQQMITRLTRRGFAKTLAAGGLSLRLLQAQEARRLKVGHTGITWQYKPTDAPQAIKDCGSLGYWGFESFGSILQYWESRGGLQHLLEQYNIPLYSAYCPYNMIDPSKLKDEVGKMVQWGQLIRKYGGKVAVLGPTSVDRQTFDYKAHKQDIVNALNEVCKGLSDIGIIGGLHQHTGTCVMSRYEVYATLDAVDTRYVQFAPDVGQLTKAGSDATKIVEDFLPIVKHIHLKDYNGSKIWTGYCPLGEGKVDIPKILDLLEASGNELMIMVELDPPEVPNPPITALQTAAMSKWYMKEQGYSFQASRMHLEMESSFHFSLAEASLGA
jgi:inosose dehydratase